MEVKPFTPEEDALIIEAYVRWGDGCWSRLASALGGSWTENAIRNHWVSMLASGAIAPDQMERITARMAAQQQPPTTMPAKTPASASQLLNMPSPHESDALAGLAALSSVAVAATTPPPGSSVGSPHHLTRGSSGSPLGANRAGTSNSGLLATYNAALKKSSLPIGTRSAPPTPPASSNFNVASSSATPGSMKKRKKTAQIAGWQLPNILKKNKYEDLQRICKEVTTLSQEKSFWGTVGEE
jgi:hypothetical protein